MSRSGYIDSDEDDALQLGRWRGMVASATRGKRGQVFFRDLLAALDAMSEKRLAKNELQTEDGEVCAMGALGRRRGINLAAIDPEDPEQVAGAFDIAECLAQEVAFVNDQWDRHQTPEQRWVMVRAWVEKQIKEAGDEQANGFPGRQEQ